MSKRFEFKEVSSEYVNNYENLERKYRVYSESAKKLVEFANIRPRDTVIDLGCGTGISSQEIYKRIDGIGKLIGVDISPRMLEAAKKKFQGKSNVKFIVGDGYHLSELIDEKVDIVLSSFTFYYFLSDLERLFDQVYEVLKPDGKYVFNITSYFTPLKFEGGEYNRFGYILWDVTDKILKEYGYEGRGEYVFDLSLLDNCDKLREILNKSGFSSVKCRLSELPITPEETLDFTYEGFFKYGSGTSFSSTLRDIPFEKRIKIIEEIIRETKKRFKEENVQEKPKIFDILAKKD